MASVKEGGGGGIAAAVAKQQNDTRLKIAAKSAEATDAERTLADRILAKAKAATKKESEEICITSTVAALLFTKVKMRNRDWNAAKSLKFARAMDRNEWKDNGDTVRFYLGGEFADAQHRIAALALAVVEREYQWTFVFGIPTDALHTIDTDRSARAAADTLKLEGVSNAKNKEAVLKAAANYLKKVRIENTIPVETNTQVIESCHHYEVELEQALELATAARHRITKPTLNEKLAGVVAFLCILSGWPLDVVGKMLYRIQTGVVPEGGSDKDPLFLAGEIITNMVDKAKGKEALRSQGVTAITLKGFLLSAQGVTATRQQTLKTAIKELPDPAFPMAADESVAAE